MFKIKVFRPAIYMLLSWPREDSLEWKEAPEAVLDTKSYELFIQQLLLYLQNCGSILII